MSFKWGDVVVSAKELTIKDESAISRMASKANTDPAESVVAYGFAEFQVAGVVEGEFPVPFVDVRDSKQVIRAAYEAWGELPRGFLQQWRAEMSGGQEDPNE